MKSRIINYKNDDNTTNAINVFGDKNTSDKIFLIAPAMGVEARYYNVLAENLAQYFVVGSVDLRGHGNSNIRPSKKVNFGYKEMILEDFHNCIKTLQKHFPEKSIYVLGHSLGGQMASLYAARFPNVLSGLILVACCSVYYKGWTGFAGYKTLLSTQFVGVVASTLGYFPGKKIGFADLEAKGVMQDWSYQSRTGNYVIKGDDFNYENALEKSKIKTLAISFEKDTYAPKEAVEHLYKKFHKDAKIKHFHLLENDPLNDNYGHFNWAKKPENIVSMIRDWIQN